VSKFHHVSAGPLEHDVRKFSPVHPNDDFGRPRGPHLISRIGRIDLKRLESSLLKDSRDRCFVRDPSTPRTVAAEI
jgi:hypothetical protein